MTNRFGTEIISVGHFLLRFSRSRNSWACWASNDAVVTKCETSVFCVENGKGPAPPRRTMKNEQIKALGVLSINRQSADASASARNHFGFDLLYLLNFIDFALCKIYILYTKCIFSILF